MTFDQAIGLVFFYGSIIALVIFVRKRKKTKQIKKRQQLIDQYQQTPYYKETQVGYDEHFKEAGVLGESLIFNELDEIAGYHKIVANCYLPKEDGSTSEVDLIMIHEKGIFVIESKDYSGWIFGNYQNKYWTQSLSGRGGAVKYRFYNPIWQNKGHIKSLNNYIDISQYPIYSYIVFSNHCELMEVTANPRDNVEVINRNRLIAAITNKLDTSEIVMNNQKVDELYGALKQTSKHDAETKNKHISNIK